MPARTLSARVSRALRALGLACAAVGLTATGSAVVGTQEGCASDPPKATAPQPIRIGVSLGLTGGLASFAAPLRDSIRAAEGQINSNGGLLGRPVVFEVVDDQGDEGDLVVKVANDFVKERVVAVIGPIGSQQVKQTQAIYAANRILQISPSATSVELATLPEQPQGDRYLFRTTPADDFQGAAVILFAQRTPGGLGGDAGAPVGDGGGAVTPCRDLAIVNIKNSYGRSMADVIEQFFPRRGGRVVVREEINVDLEPSYGPSVAKVFAANPQCMTLITYEDVGAKFIKELRASSSFATLPPGFFIIGTDGTFTSGFLELGRERANDPKSANAVEGVYGTNPDTNPRTREYEDFRLIYSSYFPLADKADAPAFTANAYDAAILIALAIQNAGSTEGSAVRDALLRVATPPGKPFGPSQLGEALTALRQGQDINYTGASGALDIDQKGNVESGYIVWKATRRETGEVAFDTVGRFTLADLAEQLK
ncbi:MAG: branched-chain amino acid ABC transporter substrate-binding protein [Polyangiaceae bacterium]